jgi:hypothetical protein
MKDPSGIAYLLPSCLVGPASWDGLEGPSPTVPTLSLILYVVDLKFLMTLNEEPIILSYTMSHKLYSKVREIRAQKSNGPMITH